MAKPIKIHPSRARGQSMAEFALALPILLLVVYGLLEVGRAVFIYAAVTNASREAVRFATAYGVNASGVLNYQNCAEIRNTARKVAFLMPLEDEDITIEYDAGPDPVAHDPDVILPLPGNPRCDPDEEVDNTIILACGDRVVVTVEANYSPMVRFVPQITAQTFTASSARTYLGVVELKDPPALCQ